MQALDDPEIDLQAFRGKIEEPVAQLESNPLLSLREWLSPENVALFVVCMADMFSTLYWVHQGVAVEDNPVFRLWLERGDGPFIGMKFASFMPLIAVSTYYRRQRPKLIKNAMRLTVAAYVLLYVGRFLAQFFGI